MYRISRVFQTSCVAILKIAGQVTDADLIGWSEFLKQVEKETSRYIVLDFCDVARVDRKPAELLIRTLAKHVLLLNGPTGVKNMADSAGFREQVLEPSAGENCCFPDAIRGTSQSREVPNEV
jgi:hypothetical protein